MLLIDICQVIIASLAVKFDCRTHRIGFDRRAG